MKLILADATEIEVTCVKQEYNPEYFDCPTDYIDIIMPASNDLSVSRLKEIFTPENTETLTVKGAKETQKLTGYSVIKLLRVDYNDERFDTVIRLTR